MIFIKPSEISSKIMSLIEEGDEFVFLVSPYVKISKWYKLLKKLDGLKERRVPFQFVVRDEASNHNTFAELEQFRLPYTSLPDLHCKVYLNEKSAIVTSMNILLSSEINSLEIGYETATPEEYAEVREFCERHLKLDFPSGKEQSLPKFGFQRMLVDTLSYRNDKQVRVFPEDSGASYSLNYNANRYTCFIWPDQKKLVISGIISENERDQFTAQPYKSRKYQNVTVECLEGKAGHYSSIQATLETPLSALRLDDLSKKEADLVIDVIKDFIFDIAQRKVEMRNRF